MDKRLLDSYETAQSGGAYVNFMMGDEGTERVKATYRDNFEHLVEIKTKYDPDNFFARNQNILPRASGAKSAKHAG